MAENKKKNSLTKKAVKGILMSILIPLIIIVMVAGIFFAIIDGIVGIITGVVKAVSNLFDGNWWKEQIKEAEANLAQLSNGWSKLWGIENFNEEAYNKYAIEPVYTISQDEFESIAESLDNSVDREKIGLDNITLKKMLLAYYKTTMLSSYEVRIAIDEENDLDEGKNINDYTFEPFTKKKIDGTWYLITKGSISICVDIIDDEGKLIKEDEELRCFKQEGIEEIYNKEYKSNLEKDYKYAQGVKRALQYCYAIDETTGGIKMLSLTTTETNKEYFYEDAKIESTENIVEDTSYEWVILDYTNDVAQYATPMEFLVTIMQITGSKDFIDDVIKLVDSNTSVKIGLYSTQKVTEETTTKEYIQNTEVTGKREVKYSAKRIDGTDEGININEVEISGDTENVILRIEDTKNKGININLYRNDEPDTELYGVTRNGTEIAIEESEANKYATTIRKNKEYQFVNGIIEITINKTTHEEKKKSDEGLIKYTETKTTEENTFDLMVEEVNNWYIKIKYEGNATNTTKALFTYDENNNQIPINEEKDAITSNLKSIEEEYGKENKSEYFADNSKYNEVSKNGKEGFINNIFNYTIRKEEEGYNYSEYNFETINISETDIKQTTLITNSNTLAYSGSQTATDKTDSFVNLLKKEYKDNYGGKIEPGKLLVNGDEMLFQLLDSSHTSSTGEDVCNTVGLSDVMRWILQKYIGISYGIIDFNQLANMYNNMFTVGMDYSVLTNNLDSELILNKQTILDTIDKMNYSQKARQNLKSAVDDFIYIQENNKVNAVFAIATTIVESSGGTNWGAIDSSTYNWMSVTGSYNGKTYKNPNSSNPRTWRVYNNFNEATRDFGDVIANGSYYFKAGRTTVKDIAPTYCSEQWGNSIVSIMTDFYKKAGVSVSAVTGGDFLSIAKSCHDYLRENNYYYSSAENKAAGKFVKDGTSTGSNIPKPYAGEGNYIDCSAYITWVLYEYGYTEFYGYQKTSNWFMNENNWKNYGWKKIPISEAQPGDIVATNGHVEIYCGDGKFLNCGSTNAIRNECDSYANATNALNRFTIAIRVQN